MGEWKHAGTIKLPFPVEASFLLSMPDRTIQGLFRNGDVLEHWTRGSRDPFPWKKQATIPGKYKKSGNIILYEDGNYLIAWPDTDEVLQTFWSKPSEWPDPSEPDPMLTPVPEKPFVGGSYYQMQIETPENIREFVQKLKEHGGNATEIFLNFSWPLSKSEPWRSYTTSGWQFSPVKIVDYWSESKFGDYRFPMFDLEQWNEVTWGKLSVLFEACREHGIVLFIRIHDYCSIKRSFYKRHYPYNNGSNIQNYTGGFYGEGIRDWFMLLNGKLMDTIHKAEVKHLVRFIPMSEADVIGDDSDEWKDDALVYFHNWYIADLKRRGVTKKQIVLSIHRPKVYKFFHDLGYRMEWHWIQSPETLRDRVNTSGDHIFPNGDGKGGGQGIASYNGNREPSHDQGIEMGKQLKDKFGYCYFMRSTEPTIEDVSVKYADFTALDGIVKGLNSTTPPPVDKKLSVENGKILYGGEYIKLCGVSRLEALWRTTGEYGWDGWGKYSLDWYENELKNSGINYVRHLGVMDTQFMFYHCLRMKEYGIIVEICVYRVGENEGVLVELDRMGELAKLGNVFFDICNEFIGTNENEVNIVNDIANSLKKQGCLISGGAWSGDGLPLSDAFLRISDVDILTHHRDWTLSSFGDTLLYMKPVVWNEYFAMKRQLPVGEIQRLMDLAFEMGIQGVNYYGFRFGGLPGLSSIDPWQSDEFNDAMLIYAGKQ